MKKELVNYRDFRLSKLFTREYSYLLLTLSWVVYLILFFLTEKLIPADKCFIVHSPLDDLIPFCEFFIIPYFLWYFLILFTFLYFLFYNVDSFKKLSYFIIITQVAGLICFTFFPTKQELRPTEFVRDNIFTDCVAFLYSIDTNTGVCPSLHVAYSLGIGSAWIKEKGVSIWFKVFIVLLVVLICASTVFLKQHSVIDFFAALPICLFAEIVVYGKSCYLKKYKLHKGE